MHAKHTYIQTYPYLSRVITIYCNDTAPRLYFTSYRRPGGKNLLSDNFCDREGYFDAMGKEFFIFFNALKKLPDEGLRVRK